MTPSTLARQPTTVEGAAHVAMREAPAAARDRQDRRDRSSHVVEQCAECGGDDLVDRLRTEQGRSPA
jgi:hypothetical protein